MRLYLCGGGSGKKIKSALIKFSQKIDPSKPILYIPFAMDASKYKSCYNWFTEEIKEMGLTEFEMVKTSKELSQKEFSNYSAIFIGGGNPYKLLNEIKQHSNDHKIYNYLYNGGTIFGGSAGAIIFGKDINCCLLEDKNDIGLKNTQGFNLLNNYSILCHLKKKNLKNNYKFLQEYSKKNKVIYLPEEDVILIEDKKISIIGTKKYIIFKNGKYTYHNFANLKKDMQNESVERSR